MRKRYTLILVDPNGKRGNARSFVMAYTEQEARVLGKRMYPQYQIKEASLEDGWHRIAITEVSREALELSLVNDKSSVVDTLSHRIKEAGIRLAKQAESDIKDINDWHKTAMDEVENE